MADLKPHDPDATQHGGNFGTFAGIFTPSILTIFGIILFLRIEFVFRNAGLRQALFIISLANIIVILTNSFLSAIAINLRGKGYGPTSNSRRGCCSLVDCLSDCRVGQSECRTIEDVHHFEI